MPFRHRVMAALFAMLALTLGGVVEPTPMAWAATDTDAETRFVDSINAERAQRGLPRLLVRADLRDVARRHSVRMADRSSLYHNPNLGTEVKDWRRVSENIGRGTSVAGLHGAFMNSSGHRANLLDANVTEVGVGVEVRGSTTWVTQVYRQPRTTATVRFRDVPSGSHSDNIHRLARSGVTMGCGDGVYCPTRSVRRAEMATFLARSKALLPRNPETFTDTGGRFSVHAANTEALRAARVTTGCSSSQFCPERPVSRAEMASFLARSLGLPMRTTTTRFSDVRDGSTHAAAIEAIARAGITEGCGSGDRFCPDHPVTRAEMASFLIRAFRL
jgi:hypothetical protein